MLCRAVHHKVFINLTELCCHRYFTVSLHRRNSSNRTMSMSDRVSLMSTDKSVASPLSPFEMYGYQPSPHNSDDVNYMDVVMIITRSSMLRQGSMGCIIVQPANQAKESKPPQQCDIVNKNGGVEGIYNQQKDVVNHGDESSSSTLAARRDHSNRLLGRVIAAATNTSLFQSDDSDVHAEINAIGQVAKHACLHHTMSLSLKTNVATNLTTQVNIKSTQNATAYITMPPCKKCFGALHASGITRIVTRKPAPGVILATAAKIGMEMVYLTDEELADQKVRLNQLFSCVRASGSLNENNNPGKSANELEEILKRRKKRKEDRSTKKKSKSGDSLGANDT